MFDLVSVKSSFHGRERREQRHIDKSDAKLARKYGIAELASGGCTGSRSSTSTSTRHGHGRRIIKKYTFKGSVFVMSNNQEITCYHSTDYASPFSGTRMTLPTLYPLDSAGCTDQAIARHRSLKRKLTKMSSLAAAPVASAVVPHTIFCVSMSSLMRQDDVNGARCRSDAIWAALARGILSPHLHEQRRKRVDDSGVEEEDSHNDDDDNECRRLVSVVALVDSNVRVVFRHEPVDAVLYNHLLSYRADWVTLRPHGQAVVGDALIRTIRSLFLPGSDSIRQHQCKSDHRDSRVATSIVFIGSDDMRFGEEASNDPQWLPRSAASLVAPGCLRRVEGIALGDDSDAASTLSSLIRAFDDASPHSVVCGMKRVPLELDSLIETVADMMMPGSGTTPVSIATCVSTDTDEGSSTTPSTVVASNAKWIPGVIEKVYLWSEAASAMAPLVDRRCASCWALVSRSSNDVANFIGLRPSKEESRSGWLCASCQASYYCVDCMNQFTLHLGSTECEALRRERQSGRILNAPPEARPGERLIPPSFKIEIEDVQSSAAVVFGGQTLRYLTQAKSPVTTESGCIGTAVCHRIGHGHWEDVDRSVRRHYKMTCRFHAVAGRICASFSEQCAELAVRTTSSSPSAVNNRRRGQVTVQPASIVEVKGGAASGCYFVSDDRNDFPMKQRPGDLARNDVETLEALGHYAARVHRFPLLVSKVVCPKDDGAIHITDLSVQHTEAACQQALEGFLRSHTCNRICAQLNIV